MEALPAPVSHQCDTTHAPVRLVLSARQVFALISHLEEPRHRDDLQDALAMHGEPDDEAALMSVRDIVSELNEAPWRAHRPVETLVTPIGSGGAVHLDGELFSHPALDAFPGRLVRVVREVQPDVVVVTTLTRTEICRIPVVTTVQL